MTSKIIDINIQNINVEEIIKEEQLKNPKKLEKQEPEIIEYICDKCNKVFTTSHRLKRHLNRKYPCDKDSRICKFCEKLFYDSSTKNRHEKDSCKMRTTSSS